MADLLSAMVRASKQVADPRVAAFASGNRPYTVRVERPNTPTYDRGTKTFDNAPDELLYEGPGRVRPATGGSILEVAGEETSFTSAVISIDAYDGPEPRVDDLVTIVADAQSIGTHVAGRSFMVTDVEVGGHFSYGYVLSVTGAAPSRRTP